MRSRSWASWWPTQRARPVLGAGAARAGRDARRRRPHALSRGRCERSTRRWRQRSAGHPQPLSWQQLLSGGLGDLGGQVSIRAAQAAGWISARWSRAARRPQAIRAAAAKLPFVRDGAAHVRITGPVALADEEFATVAQGAVAGLIGSVVLITLWLFLAVRSWRLIVPILVTLGLGLMLTLLFAAVAVGTLNLVSVGFGVLFVGIAVDFAIQFAVRYREARHDTGDAAEALRQTARARRRRRSWCAALATAAGFLAFVPTAFQRRGRAWPDRRRRHADRVPLHADLPARGDHPVPRRAASSAEVGFAWGGAAGRAGHALARGRSWWGSPHWSCWRSRLAPRLQFDSDPLDTKNPNTEAMRTLRDLMNDPLTNPYTIDILAPNVARRARWRRSSKQLPTVSQRAHDRQLRAAGPGSRSWR